MHGSTLPIPGSESPFPSVWGMLRSMLRVGHLEVIDKRDRTRHFGDPRQRVHKRDAVPLTRDYITAHRGRTTFKRPARAPEHTPM